MFTRSLSGRIQVKPAAKSASSSRSLRHIHHQVKPANKPVAIVGSLALVLVAIVVGVAAWGPGDKPKIHASTTPQVIIERETGQPSERNAPKAAATTNAEVPSQVSKVASPAVVVTSGEAALVNAKDSVKVNAKDNATASATITSAPATTQPETSPELPKGKPSVADLVKQFGSSVVVVKTDKGTGSGFVAFEADLIVTNYHVIRGSQSIEAICFDGEKTSTYPLVVVAIHVGQDLALLRANQPINTAVLEFAPGSGPHAGVEVFTIVSPGSESVDQARSASPGVIGDTEVKFGKRKFMTTSFKLSPVTSGGPMFDQSGKVVGVASVKIREGDHCNFIVPASEVKQLYRERDGKYLVGGDFAKWEGKQPFEILRQHPGAIPLKAYPTDLLLDVERDQLIGMSPSASKIVFIDLKSRKVTREIFTGTDPVAFQMGAKGELWVAHSESKDLVLLDLASGKITKTITLKQQPRTFIVGRRNFWMIDSKGQTFVIKNSGKEVVELGMDLRCLALYGSGTNMLCSSAQSWLSEFDPDRTQDAIIRRRLIKNAIDDFGAGVGVKKGDNKANAATRQNLENELISAEKVLAKAIKIYANPQSSAVDFSGEQQNLFVDEPGKRIYFNRCVLDLKDPSKIIGVFPEQEHSLKNNENLKDFFTANPGFSQIRAISPDGKLAVSGTHIYNTSDFSVIAELPMPTSSVIFHSDNKTLFLSDSINRQVISFDYLQKTDG